MSNTGVTNNNNGCIPSSCAIPGPLFCFFLFFFISGQNVCREKASFNVLYAKAHAHTKKANLILFKINKIFIHKK